MALWESHHLRCFESNLIKPLITEQDNAWYGTKHKAIHAVFARFHHPAISACAFVLLDRYWCTLSKLAKLKGKPDALPYDSAFSKTISMIN